MADALLKPNTESIRKALANPKSRYRLDGHPGVYLYARGDGSGSWMLRYRATGERRWHTLHNDAKNAKLANIIEAKDQWLARVKLHHVDPKKELEQARVQLVEEGYTVQEAFDDWLAKPRKRALAVKTLDNYTGVYRRHIKPRFGSVALASITKQDIAKAVAEIQAATTNAALSQRGLQASKALVILRMVMKFAVDNERIDRDPTRGIAEPVPNNNPAGKQTRALTPEELRSLWSEGPLIISLAKMRVIKLVLLTGRRVSEIVLARRKDARLDDSIPTLFIPANRVGNKAKVDDLVPLAPLALEIVKDALRVGQQDDPLFLGASDVRTATRAFVQFRKAKNWHGRTRQHDARTLLNDALASMGVPGEIRSRLLHHTGDLKSLVNTTYSAYDYLPEKLRALTLWEARLNEIISGATPSGLRW